MDAAEELRRGIDLENRFLSKKLEVLKTFFDSTAQGKLSSISLLFIFVLFIVNLLIVFPIVLVKVAPAYSSSVILMAAYFLEGAHLIGKEEFFKSLTILALLIAPISAYLFFWRVVFKNVLIAFVATLLFVIPSPVFKDDLPLVSVFLAGDGAHGFAFAFIPAILILADKYISSGRPFFGALSVFFFSAIAIISPFGFFNLLIFLVVIGFANGFLGDMHHKLTRTILIVLGSILLCVFWYYPNFFTKFFSIVHFKFAVLKTWSILPILIPILPILGIIGFLMFDRKIQLKPFFISISLVVIYILAFAASKIARVSGILTAERYILELTFSSSFITGIFLVLMGQSIVKFLLKKGNIFLTFIVVVFGLSVCIILSALTSLKVIALQDQIIKTSISSSNLGIGNLERVFDFNDPTAIAAAIISGLTLVFLSATLLGDLKKGKTSEAKN